MLRQFTSGSSLDTREVKMSKSVFKNRPYGRGDAPSGGSSRRGPRLRSSGSNIYVGSRVWAEPRDARSMPTLDQLSRWGKVVGVPCPRVYRISLTA